MESGIYTSLILAGALLVALIGIGIMLTKLYKKATKERSFIRTGLGGEKVIMNGGAIVFPILHETIEINMNTSKLEISRNKEQALITKDRLRVDVLAEFYVRVKLDSESISKAAQTLGYKTLNPSELKTLVEGKFVDALRSVAAEMNMSDLHEKRGEFVQKVQSTVSEDLLKNGLELESVSLTGLDQTDKAYFNPDNMFDAEGLKNLTEATEKRRHERNEIEKNTTILIDQKNLETEKLSLSIKQDQETARLNQTLEIAKLTASQESQIEKEKSEQRRAAETARIEADEEIQKREIKKSQVLEQELIVKEKLIEEKEIEKSQAINIAEQNKQIAIFNKAKEESDAKTEANTAKAKEVESNEKVITASETEKATRAKNLTILKAEEEAQKDAIKIKVEAEAKKLAAIDLAEALKIDSEAKAKAIEVDADGKAKAIKIEADANKEKYQVDADGQKKLNDSRNVLSSDQIKLEFQKELIKALPSIIEQMVKPMEKIDSIKIVDMKNGSQGGQIIDGHESTEKSLPDQVVDAALRYRTTAPMVNDLLKEAGFADLSTVSNLIGTVTK